MITPIDMPQHRKRPLPAKTDNALMEFDVILNHWLEKGLDMDQALYATDLFITYLETQP